MKTIKLLAAAGLMVATSGAYAQKGIEDGSKYGHGEDSVTCIMNLVQYGDQVKMKNYKDAFEPWKIVFEQCPLAKGTNLYTDGVKIMKDLIVKDKANQATYIDYLMRIYDQRMKYFGTNKKYPESYLKGMKALDMVKYKSASKEDRDAASALLLEALNGAPATIQPAFAQTYFSQKAKAYNDNEISSEDVVNAYILTMDILPQIEAAQGDKVKDNVAGVKTTIEQLFAQSGAADCTTLEKIFAPQLAANQSEAGWLKRVNKLLGRGDCTDNDLFYATSEALHKISPEASSARGLAKMYLKQNDVAKAMSYYDEAVKLEDDDQMKSRYYLEMGLVNFSAGNLSAAKANCYSAIGLRGDWGQPYLLLGKIYATGARNIGDKDYERKAGYWAAVDKLQKAKSVDDSESVQKEANELIRTYSQYFPSKEDLFFEGLQDGTTYRVGGFIGESTTVRAKK